MTRGQYKIRADEFYTNDILTPLERRRKVIENMKALTKEKIDEVKALIESGATRKEIAEKAGVGLSTVDRIKSGQLTAEGKPEKPKSAPKPKPEPVFTALEAAAESSSEILRIDREAAKLGMSYGHYVALKEEKGKAMDKKNEAAPVPKPEPVLAELEVAPDPITQRELNTLRVLVGQAVKAFAGIECATAADSYNLGQTFGLLSAAQMILEEDRDRE